MDDSSGIAFIGGGRMATAMASGLLAHGFSPSMLSACEINPAAAAKFAEKTGVIPSDDMNCVLSGVELAVLAVKPQQAAEILCGTCDLLSGKLLISIAAGLKLGQLKTWSKCERIIRVMPNTPALIGAAASAYAVSDAVSEDDIAIAERILQSIGTVCRVEESLLDAVTGLSGSGPAYVFEFIQGLIDGGVAEGLSLDLARQLAVQTVTGAAMLVAQSGEDPDTLCDQVKSPGGTTERGLTVLDKNNFRDIIVRAVRAATQRSRELGG